MVQKISTGLLTTVVVTAALAGAPGLAGEAGSDVEKLRDAERARRLADTTERMLEAQHEQWQERQRDIPRLIEPKPLRLDVPMYVSPKP